MPKYDGPEKRYIRRHRVSCISVTYRRRRFWKTKMTELSRPCTLSDINWRGMRFYALHRMRKGAVIEVLFECPLDVDAATDSIAIRAHVVWQEWSNRHSAWRTGVRFPQLLDESRNALLKMIDGASEHEKRYHLDEQEIL